MRGIRISTRYAKSLLDLCVQNNALDAVYSDMQLVARTIEASREFELMLLSPVIRTDKKLAVIQKVFGGSLSEISIKFISLLAHKGREALLGEVAHSFVAQTMRHKHITQAHLFTASSVSAQIKEALLSSARKLAGGEVEMKESLKEELIGGFVLRVADREVDASVAGKIKQLKREFADNPYIPEL